MGATTALKRLRPTGPLITTVVKSKGWQKLMDEQLELKMRWLKIIPTQINRAINGYGLSRQRNHGRAGLSHHCNLTAICRVRLGAHATGTDSVEASRRR